MSNRVTKKNLDAMLERYVAALRLHGDVSDFRMDEGSKVHDRAYRLFYTNGHAAPGTDNGYLGMTKGEAWTALRFMAKVLEDVKYGR
jgi:hypothetical protein